MNSDRHVLLIVALILVGCVPISASEPTTTVSLWPQGAPQEASDIGPEHELPLRPNDTTIRIENVTQPTITVFFPPKEKHCRTGVIICPGGAYKYLTWNKEGTEAAEWLNSLGITGIVLKYRVPARNGRERHSAALEDLQRAVSLVRDRSQDWDLDPSHIGVLGFSAGGNVAAYASTNFAKRRYQPVDEADKQSCRPDFSLLIYPAYLVNEQNQLDPDLEVGKDTPPTFLAMTEDDTVRVEGALFYYLALKSAQVPAEMHLYPTGGHGYGLRPIPHRVSTWPLRAGEWLETNGLLTK